MPQFSSDILATTMNVSSGTVADNINVQSVLYNHLKAKDKVRSKAIVQGVGFLTHVQRANITNKGTFYQDSTVTRSYENLLDTAKWPAAYYYGLVEVTLTDNLENQEKAQYVDMITAKIEAAQNTLIDDIENDLLTGVGPGSASSSSSKLWGLSKMIDDTTAVGGINPGTDTYWKSYVEATAAVLSYAQILTMLNNCNKYKSANGGVSLILVAQDMWEKLQALTPVTQMVNPGSASKETKRLADAGLPALEYMGVPISWSPKIASGVVYAINGNHYGLNIVPGADFKPQKIASANAFTEAQAFVFGGQVWTDARRTNGKLTGKTP